AGSAAAGAGAAALGAGAAADGAGAEAFAGSCLAAGAAPEDAAFFAGAPATTSSRMTAPMETLSPTLIFTDLTSPALGEGISMAALSDSRVINESSALITSPALT